MLISLLARNHQVLCAAFCENSLIFIKETSIIPKFRLAKELKMST